MKKLGLFITMMVGAFLMLTTNVMAQDGATGSATATATIVAPIAIASTIQMNFGSFAVDAAAGTVVLATDGVRTVTGGVTLPATAGTVTAASFAVTGEGTYTYAITIPSTAYTLTETVGTTETMDVTTFVSDPSVTGALTAGAQTILVGATLDVVGAQLAGVYTNATGFDVTVNYN